MVMVVMMVSCMNDAGSVSEAASSRVQDCEAIWLSLRSRHGDNIEAITRAWRAEEGRCAGSGVYEYHLASLAEMRGDFDGAIAVLGAALDKGTPLRDQLYVTKLGMEFNKADAARPRDLQGARKANAELEAFIEQEPDFIPAIHIAASQRARLRDFSEAETLARRGLAADPENAYSRGALVIALAATERCVEAKPMIRPTLELHDSMFEDFDFMMAAAYCYYATEEHLTAEQVLLALSNRLPGAEKEESFKKLAILIAKRKSARQ